MKLTLPAVRPREPDAHHQEVSEHTLELLDAIDALLAESSSLDARASRITR